MLLRGLILAGLVLAIPLAAVAEAAEPQPSRPLTPIKKMTAPAGPVQPVSDRVRLPMDLVVSSLAVVSKEVRFKVRNVGGAEKPPGRINYDLTITYYDLSNRQTGVRNYTGIAALTTLSRLKPYQETGEDRVTGHSIHIGENMRLELCINKDQQVREGSYANNCLVKTTRQVLPDLAILDGALYLYKPKKKEPWYKRVGDFLWDVVTGFEFDPSGIGPQDHVRLTLRNNSGVPVTNFDITAGVWGGSGPGRTYKRNFTQVLAPGERRVVAIYIHQDNKRWGDQSCCGATAMVDADQRVTESNEGNNKRSLPTRRVRDHR